MRLFLSLVFAFTLCNAKAQSPASYLRQNAIRIDDPASLSYSVYHLLSPFQVIMVGEIHGTKEPAKFVAGLTELLTRHGDSVQLGLEIPNGLMGKFLASRTDSSIYLSDFFFNPPFEDGRESFAWAKIMSEFKNDPKVRLFFFDVSDAASMSSARRDSAMYANVKKQFGEHPGWKMITLSGNVHSMTAPEYEMGRNTMASFLKHDKELNLADRICSINHFYASGTALNNYGDGLKMHRIGNSSSVYTTTFDYSYIVLEAPVEAPNTPYPYTVRYYTKEATAAKMVKGNIDISALKSELSAIYDRDQKTRRGTDSAQYMAFIDSSNLAQVAAIIDQFGWPGMSLAGARGNVAAFLVVQHAGLEVQLKYLPLLQRSVDNNESRPADLALMQDRVLMRQGKKQIYGSQVVSNKVTGAQEFWKIEDEKNVNSRRAKIGLGPIEEYAKNFGIDYKLPKE